MSISDKSTSSTARLADRLAAARQGRFVGREQDITFYVLRTMN